MLLLLLNYVVLRALWKIDVNLISTLVNNNKNVFLELVHVYFHMYVCILYIRRTYRLLLLPMCTNIVLVL